MFHYLITLLGVDGFLIKFDKSLIFCQYSIFINKVIRFVYYCSLFSTKRFLESFISDGLIIRLSSLPLIFKIKHFWQEIVQIITCIASNHSISRTETVYFTNSFSISSSDFPFVSGSLARINTKPDKQIAAYTQKVPAAPSVAFSNGNV